MGEAYNVEQPPESRDSIADDSDETSPVDTATGPGNGAALPPARGVFGWLLGLVGVLLVLVGLALAWFPQSLGLGIAGNMLIRLDTRAMKSEQGLAFTIPVNLDLESDSTGTSPVEFLEDSHALGPAHALHQAVRELGAGRYSHWGTTLYFSTSDGTDARINGRVYSIRVPQVLTPRWPNRLPLACLAVLLGFVLAAVGRPRSVVQMSTNGGPRRSRIRDVTISLLVGLGLGLYVTGASIQAQVVNTSRLAGDQSAYLAYTEGLVNQGDSFLGERNRMPGVPTLMRLVYTPGLDQETFFQRAKTLQIAISIVLLALVFATCRLVMRLEFAALVGLIAAFLLFAFKAGWVQAELLSYTLALVTLGLMVFALARSSPWLALFAGVAAGLSHLAKASAPPSVMLFLVVSGVSMVTTWVKRSEPLTARLRRTLVPVLLAVGFLVVLWPYISESKRVFGSYFYNVNSTFYMWYDSWDECLAGTGAHDDFHHWPDLPEAEIPGPFKWFERHGLSGARDRLATGWETVQKVLARDSYGYVDYALGLPFLALLLLLGSPRRAWQALRAILPSTVFVLLYFAGYATLYIWYAKVIGQQRFILSLLLPLLWVSTLVIAHCESWYPCISVRGRRVTIASVIVLLLAGLLASDIHAALTDRLWTISGGN